MTGARRPEDAVPCLARLLREARRDAGLSIRDMARLLGLSARALSHYELGTREPAHAVLRRYLARAPGLDAATLLHARPVARPVRRPGAWAALEALFGFAADEASVELRAGADGWETEVIEVRGVRPTALDLEAPVVRAALMRATCLGEPQTRRRIVPDAATAGARLAFDDALGEHSFAAPAAGAPGGFDYRRVRRRPRAPADGRDGEPLAAVLDVQHPVRRLRLAALRADDDGSPPRLLAWPSVAAFDPSRDVAPVLYPSARPVRCRAGGGWTVVIDRPLPGLGHALAWPAGGGPAPPLRLSRARGLGATLRAARQAHGLSLRQAAAALGVRSHVTVRNAERGVDVAHSTLRAYLAAFPELAPEDLLPRPARREQLGADALWEHLRDVFGLHAREIEKRVRIDQDGRVRVSVRTSDLRDLRPGAPDVKLRHGGLPGVLQASPHVIDRITGAPAALRLRRTADRDGVAHEILRFQREPAGGGLSFTVRHARTVQPLFRLVPAAVGPEWGPGPHQEGTSHRVRFPCDRLRLVVTFPPGVRPPRVFGHSGPGCLVPDPEVPRLSAALPVPRAVLRERGAVVTASVTVARPVIGFSYGLGWQVC